MLEEIKKPLRSLNILEASEEEAQNLRNNNKTGLDPHMFGLRRTSRRARGNASSQKSDDIVPAILTAANVGVDISNK